jgi:cytochrome c oxidase cbb3-type subunit III
MRVRLYYERTSLARVAAEQAAVAIRRSIGERGKKPIVGADAASQIEFLEPLIPRQLIKPDRRNSLLLRAIGAAARLILCCLLGLALPEARAQFASHAEPNGRVLFSQACAPCHGSDGRGGEHAPNIATQHDVVAMSDAGLRSIIANGIPSAGMPAFGSLGDKRVDALVAYVRVLQGITSTGPITRPGDLRAGEAIFFGQGSCSECHMVDGRGGFMADDLSDYARGRSVSSIESAIVHPANRPGDRGHWVTVETNGGETVAGLVRAQSNFTVVIQSRDGEFQSIPTDTIRSLTISKQTYMPQDYASRLSSKQLNDLISYLLQSAGSPRPVRVIPEN